MPGLFARWSASLILTPVLIACAAGDGGPAAAGAATLNMVVVLDGLRPDSITPEEMPNLWRLRQEGVNFVNSHAVFPTVTRANAAAIGTGTYPNRNGMFGNQIYVRAVEANRAFSNDAHENLLRLDAATGGGMVLVKSLGEFLAEHQKTLAVVSSGSTGSALLANPRAPKGVGVLVNAYWEPGKRVAFPDAANEAILQRFPPAPRRGGALDSYDETVSWTQRVLRDYVLSEVKPDLVINWLTEPDHTQHGIGAGSPGARASIRNDDRELGFLLERLRELGLAARTNIMIVSDHGFSHATAGVDLSGELVKAGLKEGAESDDVVIASSGQTALLHVRDHNAERIGAIVRFLQQQSFTGVLFTAGRANENGVPVEGREPGTFSLELIHMAHAERGPDIVVTFGWSSAKNPFGLSGQDSQIARTTGPLSGTGGNHGGMSPWTIRNTFIAWGPDFKRGATVRTPVSNVDVAPTLVALMNLDKDVDLKGFDGRALSEAFVEGPDEEQVPVQVRTHFVETADGNYRTAIEVTELGRQRYIDKSWRIR
jgi:predicted AlkP superfamily pyrophosphatase or phosphodiesterase